MNICRLCLRNDDHIIKQNIFDLSICDTLYWIFGVEVDIADDFSKLICQKCLKTINYVNKMKNFFQVNQYLLKERKCPQDFNIEDTDMNLDVGTQTEQVCHGDVVTVSLDTITALNCPFPAVNKLENSSIIKTFYEKVSDTVYIRRRKKLAKRTQNEVVTSKNVNIPNDTLSLPSDQDRNDLDAKKSKQNDDKNLNHDNEKSIHNDDNNSNQIHYDNLITDVNSDDSYVDIEAVDVAYTDDITEEENILSSQDTIERNSVPTSPSTQSTDITCDKEQEKPINSHSTTKKSLRRSLNVEEKDASPKIMRKSRKSLCSDYIWSLEMGSQNIINRRKSVYNVEQQSNKTNVAPNEEVIEINTDSVALPEENNIQNNLSMHNPQEEQLPPSKEVENASAAVTVNQKSGEDRTCYFKMKSVYVDLIRLEDQQLLTQKPKDNFAVEKINPVTSNEIDLTISDDDICDKQNKFTCVKCNATFRSDNALQMHREREHKFLPRRNNGRANETDKICCSKCDKTFRNKNMLRVHIAHKHAANKHKDRYKNSLKSLNNLWNFHIKTVRKNAPVQNKKDGKINHRLERTENNTQTRRNKSTKNISKLQEQTNYSLVTDSSTQAEEVETEVNVEEEDTIVDEPQNENASAVVRRKVIKVPDVIWIPEQLTVQNVSREHNYGKSLNVPSVDNTLEYQMNETKNEMFTWTSIRNILSEYIIAGTSNLEQQYKDIETKLNQVPRITSENTEILL